MGDEIAKVNFDAQDFQVFGQRLALELEQLRTWQRHGQFATGPVTTGLELEAWLLESDGTPAPDNSQFLESLSHNSVVPELAKYNFELNVEPQLVAGRGLQQMHDEMCHTWQLCGERAAQLNRRITCIGILPTVSQAMLCIKNMTPRSRFAALNQQVLRMRHGAPLRLHIEGIETLDVVHQDVMLESAATSLQVHLKVALADASRYYNAFVLASAATVGLAANAPLLFGHRLWHDTRVAVFEQAVDTGGGPQRVTFGDGYAGSDFLSLFEDKVAGYPSILPVQLEDPPEKVPHLRLHNGTLWFWNRPLIGFESDGAPHVRVEHRVMSAGPTASDMSANVALSLGLAYALANYQDSSGHRPPHLQCDFEVARNNFYAAARYGLSAPVEWLGQRGSLQTLLLEKWLPMTHRGLEALEVDAPWIASAMDVLYARTRTMRTAAHWQLESYQRHAGDTAAVVQDYLTNQATRRPVHDWEFADSRPAKASTPTALPSLHSRPELELDGLELDELELDELETWPDELNNVPAVLIERVLPHPTLIHIPGRDHRPLFISVLLHGDEDCGLQAVQQVMSEYRHSELPRALSIFVGNVRAATQNKRTLPDQLDFNRVWFGSELPRGAEHALMERVVAAMVDRRVAASIDLHNNSGRNPYYACICSLDAHHWKLASLFSPRTLYFQRPKGVQTQAFMPLCPSITCECGAIGDRGGVQAAANLILRVLSLGQGDLSGLLPAVPEHVQLYHTVATWRVRPGATLSFDSRSGSDIFLRPDLDRMNFTWLPKGTEMGQLLRPLHECIQVTDQAAVDVTSDFFEADHAGMLRLKRDALPSMLTTSLDAIRLDCVGYLMEQLQT